MPLNDHEKLHVESVLLDAQESLALDTESRAHMADIEDLSLSDYDYKMALVIGEAQEILNTGKFPRLDAPRDIHDYLEAM